MPEVAIRKRLVTVEEVFHEGGPPPAAPLKRGAIVAVVANPFTGRYVGDLSELIAVGGEPGALLARRALAALGPTGGAVESCGKAALAGEDGELEHAAALLHPGMGAPARRLIGGGPGAVLDIPLGHRDAAFVRPHFDGMEVRVDDAPRAGEILVALALTGGGRPLPRVCGLTVGGIVGADGLR